jgi:hypothetical protein
MEGCKFCDKKTGDQGQRYEVRAKNDAGETIVIGWAENPESLCKGVKLHPAMHDPEVIDRKPKTVTK